MLADITLVIVQHQGIIVDLVALRLGFFQCHGEGPQTFVGGETGIE